MKDGPTIMYDNVFVITPEVNLGLNLLKWMRLNVGVGYRVVTGVNETTSIMILIRDNGEEELF